MSKTTYITFILLVGLFVFINPLSAESNDTIPTPRQLEQMDDNSHPDKSKIVGLWVVKGVTPVYTFDASKLKKKNVEKAVKEVSKIMQSKFEELRIDFKADNVLNKTFKGEKESYGFYKLKDDKLYLHELGPGTSLFLYEFKKSNLILNIEIPSENFDLHMAVELKKLN